MVERTCWCGSSKFSSFHDGYGKCLECGTLTDLNHDPSESFLVEDDEVDFYGKKYWLDRQTSEHGTADIYNRAKSDIAERCLHWLSTLLEYRLPSAKILDIGCSHGGFVALARQAGYDACGMELSPWVIDFAKNNFGVPMIQGPVENAEISPGSLDVIVLMDVLEHLPNPKETIARCIDLLKPDGIFLIQTPQFLSEASYEDLLAKGNRFLEMLIPHEHLFLFSKDSVSQFFKGLGFHYILFEDAIFQDYDMFFLASRSNLEKASASQIEECLLKIPSGRFIQAMLSLRSRELDLARTLKECEIDRLARWEQIQKLTHDLVEEQNRSLTIKKNIYNLFGGRGDNE